MWNLDAIRYEIVREEGNFGEYKFAPLESGFGLTLGTAIRRAMLSSTEGYAPVGIYIDGVIHEFSTIDGVVEDVEQIILNVKKLVVSLEATDRAVIRFSKQGEGELKAADLIHTSEVVIHNPELHIATISSSRGKLSGEIYIRKGKGYLLEEEVEKLEDFPQSVIPVDAYFSPVLKANFKVEQVRFEESVDFDGLIVGVLTKGNVRPEEALKASVRVLIDYCQRFQDLLSGMREEEIPEDIRQMEVEKLGLPERPLNVLKKKDVKTVGDLLNYSESDLLNFDKFGKTSLEQVKDALKKMNLKLREE